jgi:O-antigen ligase
MSSNKAQNIRGSLEGNERTAVLTCYVAGLATLAITPFSSFDPINIIKFFFVCIAGFAGLLLFLKEFMAFNRSPRAQQTYLVICGLILISMFITFFFNASPTPQALYGTYGRNTGLLANLSLILISVTGALAQSEKTVSRAYSVFILTGVVCGIYCIFQYFGIDPVDWNSAYKPIYGTLGNPNFASAFMGMTASAALVLLFTYRSALIRISALVVVLSGFFVTVVSSSWQGTAMILIAVAFLTLIQIHRKFRKKYISIAAILLTLIAGLVSFLGLLGEGPLGKALQKGTLSIRIDYWRTALSAIRDNWLFGVGIDGFGEVFRKYRDQATLDRIGPNVWTNSAHNIYLDFALSYGVVALIFVLCLKLLVLKTAVAYIRSNNYSIDLYLGLFLAWLTYEIQALISINQLGVGVWGWLLAGLLYGRASSNQKVNLDSQKSSSKYMSKQRTNSEYQSLLWFAGAVLGMLLALPLLTADNNFRSSMESQKLDQIEKATKAFPQDSYRIAYIVRLLDQAKLNTQAADLTKFGLSKFPLNYDLNLLRTLLPGFSEVEKQESKQILAELNPLVDGKP